MAGEFIKGREGFLRWLEGWYEGLAPMRLGDLIDEAGGAENVGVVCADVIAAFISRGPLASPRVASIVPPIVDLFSLAYSQGIRHFVLPQDAHPIDSPEFEAWGPHAIPGTEEAETVDELKALPFSDIFQVMPKQNLDPAIGTPFAEWLEEHKNIRRFIVVGDCTNLCIYELAMHLRMRANQFKLDYEVVVPEDCVETFNIPLDVASEKGVMPHDADLLHPLFLYHMAINGIEVVSRFD